MVAASGGLLFINGFGAISGPLVVGWMMNLLGPSVFFVAIISLMDGLSLYALYRMTQRTAVAVEDTSTYAAIAPGALQVALCIAQEYAIDMASEDED